ncbi:MAG TPA: 4a-hydroxytetrahydrobiopterin dehydratase [Verrucomicrobiae bacterium]
MAKLTADQIKEALVKVPSWQRDGPAIRRTFANKDFKASIKFVNAVAKVADAADHHPDIEIQWDKVSLRLTTHSSGGLTAKDFELAARLDKLVK